jgi:hypothetical protein
MYLDLASEPLHILNEKSSRNDILSFSSKLFGIKMISKNSEKDT